jgi:hypothetical protein
MPANRCSRLVWHLGSCVALLYSKSTPPDFESVIQEVRRVTGKKHVDWHSWGGHARVLAIGDREKVQDALSAMLPSESFGVKDFT